MTEVVCDTGYLGYGFATCLTTGLWDTTTLPACSPIGTVSNCLFEYMNVSEPLFDSVVYKIQGTRDKVASSTNYTI